MIQPLGYTKNIVFKAAASSQEQNQRKTITSAVIDNSRQSTSEKKHLSYWRTLGISLLAGVGAGGLATTFCKKWRPAIGFGAIISGLFMAFDIPDMFYVGKK